ncbi:MAG TPA: biotin--[acetyl-CoA-carboxylase] ligase [Polyangiaceae bacterium]
MIDLDRELIERSLASAGVGLGRPLTVLDVSISTNDEAKAAARRGAPSGAAFVADAQTGGRGRLGRSWHSPPAENLYASFLLRPSFDVRTAPLITLAAGLAVADAITPWIGPRTVGLKWPNDVLIDERKVAGILSEAQVSERRVEWIVVGIGINARTTSFPPDIASRATSLSLCGAASVDRGSLFIAVAAALAARVALLEAGAARRIVDDFADRDALLGRTITIDGTPATALGISADGALRVRGSDGTERVHVAGDVELGTMNAVG